MADALLNLMNAVKSRVTSATAALRSQPGYSALIYNGWPSRNDLKKRMDKGTTVITVYPPPGMARDISAYSPIATEMGCATSLLYVDEMNAQFKKLRLADGDVRTFQIGSAGLPSVPVKAGEVVAAIFKRPGPLGTEDLVAARVVTGGEDLQDIVADLATRIQALAIPGITVQITAPTIVQLSFTYAPGVTRDDEIVEIRTGAFGQLFIELRREERMIWVNIWAPTVDKRSAFAEVIGNDLSALLDSTTSSSYNNITLSDGTSAKAFVVNSGILSDDEQREQVWRQTIPLRVELPIIAYVDATQIVATPVATTVLAPPGITDGIGHIPQAGGDGCFRSFCVNPWVESQLNKLTIFARCAPPSEATTSDE